MTKPAVPRELLDPVVEYFKPQRVILFGSKARGEAGRDSDIDLMVVVDDDAPPEKLSLKSRAEARRNYRRPADVFPIRAAVFERDRDIIGTLAAEADIDGIVVYGSPIGPRPIAVAASCCSGPAAVEAEMCCADDAAANVGQEDCERPPEPKPGTATAGCCSR